MEKGNKRNFRKLYWILGIIAILFIFTNPSNNDFKEYLTLNHHSSNNTFGRDHYLLVFSLYRYEFSSDSEWFNDVAIFKNSKHRDTVPEVRVAEGNVTRDYQDLQSAGYKFKQSSEQYIEDLKHGGHKFYDEIKKQNVSNMIKNRDLQGYFIKPILIDKDFIIERYYFRKTSKLNLECIGIMKNFFKLKTSIDSSFTDTTKVDFGFKDMTGGIHVLTTYDTTTTFYIY